METVITPALSIWQKESPIRPRDTKTAQNAKFDIAIIGMGLVGLWIAFHLKTRHPKKKIIILEKGPSPSGASIKNAGFSCFGSVSEIISDSKLMRSDELWDIIEMRLKGISMIKQFIGHAAIDYSPCKGYECLLGASQSFSTLGGHIAELNENLYKLTKLHPVFKISDPDKIQKFGFNGFTGMIENELEGSLHSGKLIYALLNKVRRLNVHICPYFEAKFFEQKRDCVRIGSATGATYLAEQVIVCTNGFTNDVLPLSKDYIKPGRGQILLTSPIPGLPFEGTFHAHNGYYYFRNFNSRVLLGGARNIDIEKETSTEMIISDTIQNELERFLMEHILPFRHDYEITDRWSGIMGFTPSHKPTMYTLDGDAIHIVCACNGMGVSTAPAYTHSLVDRF